MDSTNIKKLIDKYSYLKIMSDHILFISNDDFKKIKTSQQIQIDTGMHINIEFLKRILKNNNYYEYALKFFTDKIKSFKVGTINKNDLGDLIGYSKISIIKGIEKLCNTNSLLLNKEEKEKFENLAKNISFEKFLKLYQEENYNITIENHQYSISIKQMISFLQISKQKFKKLCINNNYKTISNIPKKHFIYAVYHFFKEENILNKYLIPKNIVDRFYDIKYNQTIDIESINKILKTEDTSYQKVTINNELEKAIISKMPKDITLLEKAIYIYIKMCRLLRYDDEYYVMDQKGTVAKKHKNIDYIANITPLNNKIVCFEFNLIYSKFLSNLGLNFTSNYINSKKDYYGKGHVSLDFKSDKYLITADAVTSILQGDLLQAKLNQPLVGLRCINMNKTTQNEFKEIITKIYQLILDQDKKKAINIGIEHAQTYKKLMEEQSNFNTNLKTINLGKRLSILINKVNSTGIIGIDSLSYLYQLINIFFDEQEKSKNISYTIIRNNKPVEVEKEAMASAIITINNYSYITHPEFNIYYFFSPKQELLTISKKELQYNFDNKTFEYIKNNIPYIPDIKVKKLKK